MGGGVAHRCTQDAEGSAGEAWRGVGHAPSATRSACVRRPRGPGCRCRVSPIVGGADVAVTGYGLWFRKKLRPW